MGVRVTPRARRDVIAGYRDDMLLVRLAAPPVEGAANEALAALLAEALDVPRRNIDIVAGARSRQKRVAVRGWPADELNRRLHDLLKSGAGTGRL
jgi:uncharacterized protein